MKRYLILFLLIIPFLGSCDFLQKRDMFSGNDDSVKLYKDKQDSLAFVDSIRELHDKISSLKKEQRQLIDSIKRSSPAQATSGGGYQYYVILGSFKNKKYLESYNRYVQERGFQTTLLKNKYGFHMVGVEPANSWNQALSTLKQLREDFESSAWIYAQR